MAPYHPAPGMWPLQSSAASTSVKQTASCSIGALPKWHPATQYPVGRPRWHWSPPKYLPTLGDHPTYIDAPQKQRSNLAASHTENLPCTPLHQQQLWPNPTASTTEVFFIHQCVCSSLGQNSHPVRLGTSHAQKYTYNSCRPTTAEDLVQPTQDTSLEHLTLVTCGGGGLGRLCYWAL